VKTSPGRQRLNVLAALNPFQHEIVKIANIGYITADTVCALLSKLHESTPKKPITLVLDNARYQRCNKVQDLAYALRIELLFLPPYSPNLNLIERLWKFIKKECVHSRYFENFQEFSTTILSAIDHAYERYPDKLVTLLTPKFQVFDSSNV
jgi:transposase